MTAETTYTFTVKAMDTTGNKSDGVEKEAKMSLEQLDELKITLVPSVTKPTNQDVTVKVDATSSSSVSKVYYVDKIATIDEVLEGTDISSDKEFAATSNGNFTVAVVDYDGRRELSYINISNIDKQPPQAPVNLVASYDSSKKTVKVTWVAIDSDVDYYLINYTKPGADDVTEEKLEKEEYTVENVEAGTSDEKFSFSVKAVDMAGNKGNVASVELKDQIKYDVGDIILENGRKVDVENIESYKIDNTNKPVAVVVGFNSKNMVLGLGLKQSETVLLWSTFRGLFFDDVSVKYTGNKDNGYNFTGDLDGSDNWEYICCVDTTFTQKAEENYKGFYFAANYGTVTAGFDSKNELAEGWYIPSIAELYEVYKNKDILQKSLTKAGGFTFTESMYMSSSQASGGYEKTPMLYFKNGNISSQYKNTAAWVVVLRAFE